MEWLAMPIGLGIGAVLSVAGFSFGIWLGKGVITEGTRRYRLGVKFEKWMDRLGERFFS